MAPPMNPMTDEEESEFYKKFEGKLSILRFPPNSNDETNNFCEVGKVIVSTKGFTDFVDNRLQKICIIDPKPDEMDKYKIIADLLIKNEEDNIPHYKGVLREERRFGDNPKFIIRYFCENTDEPNIHIYYLAIIKKIEYVPRDYMFFAMRVSFSY